MYRDLADDICAASTSECGAIMLQSKYQYQPLTITHHKCSTSLSTVPSYLENRLPEVRSPEADENLVYSIKAMGPK